MVSNKESKDDEYKGKGSKVESDNKSKADKVKAEKAKFDKDKAERAKGKTKVVADVAKEKSSPRLYGLLGAIAAAAGLAVAELVAGLMAKPGPLVGVASRVIEIAPMWLVDVGRAMFNTNNKFALGVGIFIITVIVGFFAMRTKSLEIFAGVLGVFSLISILAIAYDPQANIFDAIVFTLITVVVALIVVIAGQSLLNDEPQTVSGDKGAPAIAGDDSRRKFFGFAASAGILTGLAGFGAFSSRGSGQVDAARDAVVFRDPQNPEILDLSLIHI